MLKKLKWINKISPLSLYGRRKAIRGLKGYKVRSKKFPATNKGWIEANMYASSLKGKVKIYYLY